MGILDTLKNLFNDSGKKTDTDDRTSYLEEIKNKGINQFLADLKYETDSAINNQFIATRKVIADSLERAETAIQLLESHDLSKVRLPDREKTIILIGKIEYTNHMLQLSKVVRESLSTITASEIGSLIQIIDSYAKKSTKSYMKVTYVVGKEVEKITQQFVSIRKTIDAFNKGNGSQLEKAQKIENITTTIQQEQQLSSDLKRIEQDMLKDEKALTALDTTIAELKKEIDNIRKGEEYTHLRTLNESRRDQTQDLEKYSLALTSLLDRRMLEKYNHAVHDRKTQKMVTAYLSNSLDAFMNDSDMRIMNVVEHLQRMISHGSIVLKDPEKSLQKISRAIQELPEIKDKLIHLRNSITDIDKQLSQIQDETQPVEEKVNRYVRDRENTVTQAGELVRKKEKIQEKLNLIGLSLRPEKIVSALL